MIRCLLLAVFLALPSTAIAQETLEGSWALRLEGAIIMRWDIERDGQEWTGAWTKPDSFASDGRRFARIQLPAVEREADEARSIGEWTELRFDDPDGTDDPDVFRFRLLDSRRAEMIYVGTGLPPFALERVIEDARLGPFEEGRVYGETRPTVRRATAPERPSGEGAPAMIGR